MQVAIYTLGCKVNQYESQAMEGELLRRGHDLVPFEGPADRARRTPTSSIPAPSPPSATRNPGR